MINGPHLKNRKNFLPKGTLHLSSNLKPIAGVSNML